MAKVPSQLSSVNPNRMYSSGIGQTHQQASVQGPNQGSPGFIRWNNPSSGLQRLEKNDLTKALVNGDGKKLYISEDKEVHQLLKKLGVSQEVIDRGSLKLKDIPDQGNQEFFQAFLLICENETHKYGRGAKDDGSPKGFNQLNRDTLTKGKAQLALKLLEDHPDKIQKLFADSNPTPENRRQSAIILENMIIDKNKMRESVGKTHLPNLIGNERQFCSASDRSINDFKENGFTNNDLKGIFCSKADDPNLQKVGKSVIKVNFSGSIPEGQFSGAGSGVILKDPQSPGGVKILTALHVVDKDFKSSTRHYHDDIKVTIDGTDYKIDQDHILYNKKDGDFVTLYLSKSDNPPDFSDLAAKVAEKVPSSGDEVYAIGYPQVDRSQKTKYYSAGNFLATTSFKQYNEPTEVIPRLGCASDLVVNYGNSGGALVNKNGEVVGINIFIPQVEVNIEKSNGKKKKKAHITEITCSMLITPDALSSKSVE